MQKHHDSGWLIKVVNDSVKSFNDSCDIKLLRDEKADDGASSGPAGERAIAHRFAVHIEQVLRDAGYPNESTPIATDCEYNRHRGAVKVHYIKEELKKRVEDADRKARKDPKREGWYFFSIFPDIIVHERGIDENNLVVVEMKRASNDLDNDYDKLKLELFTKQNYEQGYGYRLGASVMALDKTVTDARKLVVARWFIDGQQVP